MTHEGRLIAGTGVWTGGAFEASRRPELSPKMPPYNSVAIGVGSGELSRAPPLYEIAARVRCPRGRRASTVGGVEGAHAQGIQAQIHRGVAAGRKPQHCGAVGSGTLAPVHPG